jgi:2-polyprenyl-3-methyl-5-hydroxy-6-metoxy-1,4-benzoquinol methylase
MKDSQAYSDFYEELGAKYPETEFVHKNRGVGTRYWTVIQELRPFAIKGLSLLDVGCNDGVYSIHYAELGGNVVGADISKSLIEKARLKAKDLGVSDRCLFVQSDAESLQLDRKFDIVLFSEVLEHMRNPSRALKAISKHMKDGGVLLLTTPTPMFERLVNFDLRYIVRTLTRKKLLESQNIDSGKNRIRKFEIPPYLYRHDGYYPLALVEYAELFGFRCEKIYTMDFLGRMRFLGELRLRRVPILKLLGKTNILILRKKPQITQM